MRHETRPVRAADVIKFIEGFCRVPEGKLVGEPLKLAPFQRDFVEAVYDNPAGTRRALLSMGRKGAKTTLCACLLLNHLVGPSAKDRPNSQLYSCAQSRDQASLIFGAATKMVRMNPELVSAVKIQETAKALSCPELGTHYRALSAEANTAFGLSPQFCIFDELGRVRGARDTLFEALSTATSALEDPLSVVISTQAASDGDLLSILIDDALAGNDPQTIVRLYAASPEMDSFSEEAIRAANPALDYFMNKTEIMRMAADARRMPAREAEFRNLVLNQRVDISSPFLAKEIWTSCGAEPGDLHGCMVFGGLDLSAVGDLTCLVLAGLDPITAKWSIKPIFWLPEQGLLQRSRADRFPYDVWADRGLIELTPGGSVSYDYVAERLHDLVDDYNVQKIAYDRWGLQYLKPCLERAGFPSHAIEQKFVEHGQGYKDMSPALRNLESLILDGKIRHGNHPVLTMCAANAVVSVDEAGNRKLNKKRARGRIDGMIALAMALAATPKALTRPFDAAALIG
jgi:phage terminase large subunit-like protein